MSSHILRNTQQQAHQLGKDAVVRNGRRVQAKVEVLEEPDHHRGDEDDGEGPLQKVLGLLPQEPVTFLGLSVCSAPAVITIHEYFSAR